MKNKVKSLPFFFIIGRPRSGTTLLRTLFDVHPNVIIPLERPAFRQAQIQLCRNITEQNIRLGNKKFLIFDVVKKLAE